MLPIFFVFQKDRHSKGGLSYELYLTDHTQPRRYFKITEPRERRKDVWHAFSFCFPPTILTTLLLGTHPPSPLVRGKELNLSDAI